MKGAREFHSIINRAVYRELGGLVPTNECTRGGDSRSYRFGNTVFTTASHARGKEFFITLVDANTKLQVYGVTGGNPGWTETYGWTKKGTWVKSILQYLRNLEKEIEACDAAEEEKERERDREANKVIGEKVNKFNEMFRCG